MDGLKRRLAVWSRRKQQAVAGPAARDNMRPETAGSTFQNPQPASTLPPDGQDEEAPPPSGLPEIAGLGPDSDFKPFLAQGVPEALHREALRMLWRSDPMFAHRDGLTDYDEDYTKIGIISQTVHTAYRVGSGYAEVPSEPTPEAAERAAAEAGGDAAEPTAATASRGDPDGTAAAPDAPADENLSKTFT